jgi:hypothetical protein
VEEQLAPGLLLRFLSKGNCVEAPGFNFHQTITH